MRYDIRYSLNSLLPLLAGIIFISTSDSTQHPVVVPVIGPNRVRLLQTIAGRIVSALMAYAPFAGGSTQPWAIQQVQRCLGIALACFVLFHLLNWRKPRVAWLPVLAGLLALLLGWFMVYNAHTVWDPFHARAVPRLPRFPLLPGAEEMLTARLAMQRLDVLFGAFLIVYDMAAERLWRREWMLVIAGTGAACAVFGIAQQAGFATFVPTRMYQMEGVYFATYNYHGNAGALMNLAEATICGFCLYVFAGRRSIKKKVAAVAILLVILLGQFTNSSRGAQAIAVVMLLAMAMVAAATVGASRRSWFTRRRVLLPVICGVLLILLLPAFMLSHGNIEKWRELPKHAAHNSSRWQVWKVTMAMVRAEGPLGYGPGSFKLLLPQSKNLTHAFYSRWVIQTHTPGGNISMWSMAHNDLLQGLVEHGWVGLLCSMCMLGCGLVIGVWRYTVICKVRAYQDAGLLLGCIAGVCATLVHSMFDFPLQVLSIQLPFAVMLAICWSSTRWKTHSIARIVELEPAKQLAS